MIRNTIFAPITAIGGAIITIRISGAKSIDIIKQIYQIEPKHMSIHVGHITDPRTYEKIDHTVMLFFVAPHSFTGEDVAEISIHGSISILKKVSEILRYLGAFDAKAGDFSRRALLNNKIDLVQAEGINLLIRSETDEQRKLAKLSTDGILSKFYNKTRSELIDAAAIIESLIDFPDVINPDLINDFFNQISSLKYLIAEHINKSLIAEDLFRGIDIANVGSTNVGKSSIINAIANRDVSIVSNIHGTTRDTISATLEISGYKVTLTDTAGIRDTNDPIEKEGILRTMKALSTSDIKILVIDIQDIESISNHNDAYDIIILNKTDLIDNESISHAISSVMNNMKDIKIDNIIAISSLSTNDINRLMTFLSDIIQQNRSHISDVAMITKSQLHYLDKTLDEIKLINIKDDIELIAEHIRMAIHYIGHITGHIQTDDILDVIFNNFCIGK